MEDWHEYLVDLQSKVVFKFTARALRDPKDDGRKHHRDALRDIGVAIIGKLVRVPIQDVFQDQHRLETCHQFVQPTRKINVHVQHSPPARQP
jgi:hypothetical protein